MRISLFHLLGIDTKSDIEFGEDLFSPKHRNFSVFRDGRFVTERFVWAANTCYSNETEDQVDKSYCEPFFEKANTELNYSVKIINGDLLRFYERKSSK